MTSNSGGAALSVTSLWMLLLRFEMSMKKCCWWWWWCQKKWCTCRNTIHAICCQWNNGCQQVCPTSQHGLVCFCAKGVGAGTSRLEAVQVSYEWEGSLISAMASVVKGRPQCKCIRAIAMCVLCWDVWKTSCFVWRLGQESNVSRMPMNFAFTMNGFGHQSVMWMERIQRLWTPTSQKRTFCGQDIRPPLEVLSGNHFASWC